jgi:hypothetical protein
MPRRSTPNRADAQSDPFALEQLKWRRIEACLTFAAVVIGTITIGTVIVLVFRQLYPNSMNGADAVNLFYLFISIFMPIVPAFRIFQISAQK